MYKKKKYFAIGHFKKSKKITHFHGYGYSSKQQFLNELKMDSFTPYIIFTEKTYKNIRFANYQQIRDQVTRLTTNYRKYDLIAEYVNSNFGCLKDYFEQ